MTRSSMQIGVRQQRQEARALDRGGQLPLIVRLGAGDARWNDSAILVDKILEQIDVLVVDLLDAFRGKAAELAPLEQRAEAALGILALVLALGSWFTPASH